MPYSITSTDWQTDQLSLMNIRELVFMREQNVSAADEWDEWDATATHFLVRNNKGDAIGCARVLQETHNAQTCFHIGRVAILNNWRGQGIGQQLMQTIITWCQQQHSSSPMYLYAQTERIRFYQRLNFEAQGNVFMDAGIPHIAMWYKITA